MTEDQGSRPDPEGDARLRALLAGLGSGSTGSEMPAHVAARLEDTLVALVASRDGADPADGGIDPEVTGRATVLPLRARWLPRVAVAAAVLVVLGGVVVATGAFGLLGGSTVTADRATSGAASAEKAPTPTGSGVPLQDSEQDRSQVGSGGASSGVAADLPAVGAASFGRDVTRLLRTGRVPADRSAASAGASEVPPTTGRTARESCPGPGTTDATTTPIRYDGSLAALLVHPRSRGARLVEAWTCSGETRLASARVAP